MTKDKKKKKKDNKAMTHIHLHLSNDVLQDVLQLCMTKSLSIKLHLKQRLYSYCLEEAT